MGHSHYVHGMYRSASSGSDLRTLQNVCVRTLEERTKPLVSSTYTCNLNIVLILLPVRFHHKTSTYVIVVRVFFVLLTSPLPKFGVDRRRQAGNKDFPTSTLTHRCHTSHSTTCWMTGKFEDFVGFPFMRIDAWVSL